MKRKWSAAGLSYLCLFCELIECCLDIKNRTTGLVVGSTPAPCDRYPYMVSIRSPGNGMHICGGALVRRSWVLTAKECVQDSPHYEVHIGSNSIDDAHEVRIGTVTLEDGWRQEPGGLALLKLNETSNQTRAKLPIEMKKPDGELRAVGWGRTSLRGQFQTDLHHRLYDSSLLRKECQIQYPELNMENYICVGDASVICLGDNGGPLVTPGAQQKKDVLVGIAFSPRSYGSQCALLGKPTLFTSVSTRLKWILQVIGN